MMPQLFAGLSNEPCTKAGERLKGTLPFAGGVTVPDASGALFNGPLASAIFHVWLAVQSTRVAAAASQGRQSP
jgi:hypothetical protein